MQALIWMARSHPHFWWIMRLLHRDRSDSTEQFGLELIAERLADMSRRGLAMTPYNKVIQKEDNDEI
jgi:hypothetical protein